MFPRIFLALFVINLASTVVALSKGLEDEVPRCLMQNPDIQKFDSGKRLFLDRAASRTMKSSAKFRTEEIVRGEIYDIVKNEKAFSGSSPTAVEIANIAGDCFSSGVKNIIARTAEKAASRTH